MMSTFGRILKNLTFVIVKSLAEGGLSMTIVNSFLSAPTEWNENKVGTIQLNISSKTFNKCGGIDLNFKLSRFHPQVLLYWKMV